MKPVAILDTNIWLDWLLFGDLSTERIAAAHATARVEIVVSDPIVEEFHAVIRRSRFDRFDDRRADAAQRFAAIARRIDTPLRGSALRCSDPGDQPFLDLAQAVGAHWLLTKDKALLKLARRARVEHGLTICPAAQWVNAGAC